MKIIQFYFCLLLINFSILLAISACKKEAVQEKINSNKSAVESFADHSDVTVTTYAGSEEEGQADGSALKAKFKQLYGITVANYGSMYVTDPYNNAIRKISSLLPNHRVSTVVCAVKSPLLAGGWIGSGLAIGPDGNMYVPRDYVILKVTPNGDVSIFAGSVKGYEDGPIGIAKFNVISDIAFDSTGVMYIADMWNHKIRKISVDGIVSTIAGSTQGYADGMGSNAKFSIPSGIAVTTDGIVYVGEVGNNKIRKINKMGIVTTIAGSSQGYADGIGISAKFDHPDYLTVGPGNILYVSDTKNNRIRRISSSGIVTTLAGGDWGYVDGTGLESRFMAPQGILYYQGSLFIAEHGRVRKIDLN